MPGTDLPLSGEARLAVLEAFVRRAAQSERDMWQELREQRDVAAKDIKELQAAIATLGREFHQILDRNMQASAEIITAAREVVKRVDDTVRRQEVGETLAHETGERLHTLETTAAREDGRRKTIVALWATLSGGVAAVVATLIHKFWG